MPNNKIIFKIFRAFFVLFLLNFSICICIGAGFSELEVSSKKVSEPTKLFLGILSSELNSMGPYIASVLNSTDNFSVFVKNNFKLTSNKQIKDLFSSGFCLAVFLSENKADKSFIECRIYDSAESKMIKGVKIKKSSSISDTVYNITDKIWASLTLEKSSFCSKIAYIQNLINTKNKSNSCSIFMCDYNGQNKKKILSSNNNYLGLYWSNNLNEPALFCSEFTKFNVRLVSILPFDTNKNIRNNIKSNNKSIFKSTIWDFNGTCVGISLSPDNNQAVYCRSGDIWYYKFNRDKKRGEHIKFISNDGKNIYPILLPNGDLVFCSDSKQLSNGLTPKICYYNSKSKKVDLITDTGYSISPTYCHLNNKLAYSKKVDNFFQLFIYDFSSKQHEQITFDKSNKIDGSWSPCGNFLVFCYKLSNLSRIGIIKVDTKKQKFITNSKDCCSSPSWSPIYNSFLL